MVIPPSLLLSWFSNWSSPLCSTVYLEQNQDHAFLEGLNEHAKVISEQPWTLMNQVLSPDCASLIVNDNNLAKVQDTLNAVRRTRMKSTMGLIMANSTTLDAIERTEPFFNIHVLTRQTIGSLYGKVI